MHADLISKLDTKLGKSMIHSESYYGQLFARVYSSALINEDMFPINVNDEVARVLGFVSAEAASIYILSETQQHVDYVKHYVLGRSKIDLDTGRAAKQQVQEFIYLSAESFKRLAMRSSYMIDNYRGWIENVILMAYRDILKEIDAEKDELEWVTREQDDHIENNERDLMKENEHLRRELASLTEDFEESQRRVRWLSHNSRHLSSDHPILK